MKHSEHQPFTDHNRVREQSVYSHSFVIVWIDFKESTTNNLNFILRALRMKIYVKKEDKAVQQTRFTLGKKKKTQSSNIN